MTSAGIINFTSSDVDVGQHLITITASDGKLTNSSVFNFTIYNIPDSPNISSVTGDNITGTIGMGLSVSANENERVTFYLQVYDNDFKIPSTQSAFYSENLTINTTLFNLTSTSSIPSLSFLLSSHEGGSNLSIYSANFTPSNLNTGTYNFTINVTDKQNLSDIFYFNFTINGVNDVPILTTIENQSIKITDIFYLNINATDQEDGNDTLGKLNFTTPNELLYP
jgi:hypothetical protein